MLVEPDPAADCTAQLRPLAPRAARFVHIMVPDRASYVGLLPVRKPNPIAGRRTRHRGACVFSENHQVRLQLETAFWLLGRCNTISATRTSSIRFDIASFLPSGSAISGRTRER